MNLLAVFGSNKYFTVSLKTGENWLRNNTGHWSIGSFVQHLTNPVMLIGKVIAPGHMKRICNWCNNTTFILLSIIATVRSIRDVQGTDGTEIPAGELHHTHVIRKHIPYVWRKVRIRTIFLRKPRILAPRRYPRIAQTILSWFYVCTAQTVDTRFAIRGSRQRTSGCPPWCADRPWIYNTKA